MSPVLPFDIVYLIIDIVEESKDTNLLRELALVSHSFLQICYKHLYATIELHDAEKGSVKRFVELLEKRPDIVKYICKLTYRVDCSTYLRPDRLLSPVLPNLLRTISGLNSLTITSVTMLDWKALDSSLTSAFLHLMHLPTINHIELSCFDNFPPSSLIPAVNLLRLDISHLGCGDPREEDGSPEFVVQSEIPKIREFHTTESHLITTKLLHAKRQDGQPAFNFMSLRRLSISSISSENEGNIRYLLQNAKLLEKLHLSIGSRPFALAGLRYNLFPTARTLKVLDLRVSLHCDSLVLALAGLCEDLEAMVGHNNRLESLSFQVLVTDCYVVEGYIGPIIQEVQKVLDLLVKPGWSAFRQVSFEFSFLRGSRNNATKLSKALQSLPDKYLNLSKRVATNLRQSNAVMCEVTAICIKVGGCRFGKLETNKTQ